MEVIKNQPARWADEIEDDDFAPTISEPKVKETKVAPPKPRDGERIVIEIKVDPESGKKTKIFKTFRLEKQLGRFQNFK